MDLERESNLLVILGGKSIDRFGVNAACLLDKNEGIWETAQRVQAWKSYSKPFVMRYIGTLSLKNHHTISRVNRDMD